jgi:hypothetical protein
MTHEARLRQYVRALEEQLRTGARPSIRTVPASRI